jgi:hypothetical protein
MEALNRDENGTMLMQHLSGRPRVRRSAFPICRAFSSIVATSSGVACCFGPYGSKLLWHDIPRPYGVFVIGLRRPAKLYKYTSLEDQRRQWTKNLVFDSVLFFARPSMSNDPLDCSSRDSEA